MLSSDVMRGFNSLIILSLLLESDSYGYKISQAIKEQTKGIYLMKETTLYSAFNRMEKEGWIESYSNNMTHGKSRTYYRITPLGKEVFQHKRTEWELTKEVMDHFTKGAKKYGNDIELS